jgi:hypothetical protein
VPETSPRPAGPAVVGSIRDREIPTVRGCHTGHFGVAAAEGATTADRRSILGELLEQTPSRRSRNSQLDELTSPHAFKGSLTGGKDAHANPTDQESPSERNN